jgi:PHD/YefM family antitoxin component YafN of YafNO toxin-antitoxin module
MLNYNHNELVSSSAIVRKFGDFLNKLKTKKLEKIAILKNNRVEAVILPIHEYEKYQNILDYFEHKEIAKLIEEREKDGSDFIDFEDILQENDINDEAL